MSDEANAHARNLREKLERWGLDIWPSASYGDGALDVEKLKAENLPFAHLLAWREHATRWLDGNTTLVTDPETLAAINDTYQRLRETPPTRPGSDNDTGSVVLVSRVLWDTHQVFLTGQPWQRPKPGVTVPAYVREYYGILGPETDDAAGRDKTRHPAIPRPVISPAFMHDGRQGLGRISSSQISLALFTACVAPKSEWGATAKGFPRYVFTVPSGEVVIMLTPEVIVRGDTAGQVAAMNKIRDELRVDDWDLLAVLMEQVFTEGRSDASAFMTDDAVLNYRRIEQKKRGRYKVGHHSIPRARIDACLNHIAHLHIRTNTLHILEDTGTGKPRTVALDCNEKVIKIRGNITRRDDDATMGWSYEFGKTFTTFLHRPNNYVGYLLQGTVALDGRKETAKQLAHYLTLHTRIDAKNGRGMERFMGELVDGAKLPHNPNRPQRTIDDTEDALREVVRAGLYRFEHGDKMFDADSADLDAWTALPKNAKGYGLLKMWQQQKVVIRAEPDIEARYDRYRRPVLRPNGG